MINRFNLPAIKVLMKGNKHYQFEFEIDLRNKKDDMNNFIEFYTNHPHFLLSLLKLQASEEIVEQMKAIYGLVLNSDQVKRNPE